MEGVSCSSLQLHFGILWLHMLKLYLDLYFSHCERTIKLGQLIHLVCVCGEGGGCDHKVDHYGLILESLTTSCMQTQICITLAVQFIDLSVTMSDRSYRSCVEIHSRSSTLLNTKGPTPSPFWRAFYAILIHNP